MKSHSLRNNQARIAIALLALFSALYGGFFSSCHHHEDGRIKAECPDCGFQINDNNAEIVVNNSDLEPPQFVGTPAVPANVLPVQTLILSNVHSHAPPLFS